MLFRCLLLLLGLLIHCPLDRACPAADLFEKPVRLKADGKIIDTGQNIGHSSPCIEDLDGDGLDDLILGDFGGHFQFYKNVGSRHAPVYQDKGRVQADGQDAAVNIYCCVGAQPRFVDLDGDGIRDFISSSYDPGYCYFFRGLPNHKFAAPVELKDKTGVPVRSAPKQEQNIESYGSFYTPVDWDGDGDFDILIGCFDGHLLLRLNEGSAEKYAFAAENQTINAGGKPLKVNEHCCPVVADWDQDGLPDLLSGSDEGSVTWFKNVGSKTAPEFAEGKILVPKHEGTRYDKVIWNEDDIVPGHRSQIEVVDYNQDGKPDLILGDFCTSFDFRKDLTRQEKVEVNQLLAKENAIVNAFREKLKALQDDFRERYPGAKIFSDQANQEWKKAFQEFKTSPAAKAMDEYDPEFSRQMRPFLASTHGKRNRSYDLAQPHGYVWLYLRK